MASTSTERPTPSVVEILSLGASLPLCIPSDPQGVARVSVQLLSIRFGFDASCLWLERDVVDPVTFDVQYSMVVEPSPVLVNGNHVWDLTTGKYRLYGLTVSVMAASTVLLTPRSSSTLSTATLALRRVKVEPGERVSIDLSESSDDERYNSVPST